MDWRQSLAGVDEDYLVGISNKGIVKRAYKDLEAAGSEAQAAVAELDWTAQELTVAAGGETVTIQFPLGESRCSCPSRSICRHVVMAILLAQQAASNGSDGTDGGGNGERGAQSEVEVGDGECGARSEAETGNADGSEHFAKKSENASGDHQDKAQGKSLGGDPQEEVRAESGSNGSLGQLVWQEILTQPRKPLLRALGSKGLRRLAAVMEAGNAPQVERGTVVRMQLPGQDMTVKLLSPLEYSTCTCHKKELCSHKAEAILWCQYLGKQLTAQDLAGELEQEPAFDLEELRDTADQVRDCLEHLLETGLARSGAEQAQELERLAIRCHNAGLPGWEGDIRALAEGYEKYLRRAAGQTMEKLAGQLQRLYDKTKKLEMLIDKALSNAGNTALNEPEHKKEAALNGLEQEHKQDTDPQHVGVITSQIQALAGEFRSEYLPVGDLELTGITMEHFVSDSGYEGDTVYFLEISTGTWYTYTNARPTFYEGKKRRGYQEKAPAPWGVSLPLEGLASIRLQLRGAKCDAGGRLSSSQETKGEILGKSELTAAKLEGWYYREYDRLFAEQIPGPGKELRFGKNAGQQAADGAALPVGNASIDRSGYPRLVFVQAAKFEQGKFNEITQKLELPIWDEAGRKVLVELPYTKRDEASIRYLERLKKKQQPCFLGRVYLQGSQICLYPVDLLERQELEDGEESDPAKETGSFWKKLFPEKKTGERRELSEDASAVVAATHNGATCQALQSYLEDVSWLLQEIYQVGSATVQDSTLEALRCAEKQGASYGMATLADWLRQLGDQLSQSRHRLRNQYSEIMDLFCRLWRYVQLCRQRTAYDMAGLMYQDI